MRSPALAIAWELGRRHRWGFGAAAGYLLLLWTARAVGAGFGVQAAMDEQLSFAFTFTVPTSIFLFYFVAVFSYGLSGDLAARESQFPARMFALPVSTPALAGWPMLYGAAAAAALWLATAPFVTWPSDIHLPRFLPPLFIAAMLAWAQALTWMPYGLPGMRVVVAVLWLVTVDTAGFVAIQWHVPDHLMLAFLVPQVPLAYLVACYAVSRARRGDIPDWRGKLAWLGALAARSRRRPQAFRSAARAQAWLEWRLHGRVLPAWVATVLPFELAFLFLAAGTETPSLARYALAGALLTPPFIAAFVARRVRLADPDARDVGGLSPFIAARPLTSAALVAAKLRMTLWSTLATWTLVAIAVPAALTLSDTWPVVTEPARRLSELIGSARAVVLAVLVLAGLVASTWKQLVQGLYLGLSGRDGLIRAGTALLLAALIFIEPVIQWIRQSDTAQVSLWNALPWILAALAGAKLAAAAWLAPRLQSSRLFPDRTLLAGAAAWLVAVLALHGTLVWLVLAPRFPIYVFLLLAILAVPLVRLSAAPLALARNRHG